MQIASASELLASVTEAIDALHDYGARSLSDGKTIVALQEQLTRLEALVTEATSEFDLWGEWGSDGARTADSWICNRSHLAPRDSRLRIARGRALRHLPLTAEAFAAGAINAAHVDALMGARRPGTEEAMARDEGVLVEQAKTLTFKDFIRVLAYWQQRADPDGTERRAKAQRDARDAYLVKSIDGMFLGKLTLNPINGAIVSGVLERIERELFEADCAEATERLGYKPTYAHLRRTPGQRRADAFVEMATRCEMAPPGGRRPAPLFSVFVDYELLSGRMCELANGTVVTPGSLLPWLQVADVERAVFSPGGRVEVSETARFFTGATRRAIELRDRECTHDFCDERLDRCQCDHIELASEGGPTTQENGRLLCGWHNRLRNGRPPPAGEEP